MSNFSSIENDSTNQWIPWYKMKPSEQTTSSEPVILPMVSTPIVKTDAKLTEAGNVPLAQQTSKTVETGLTIEKNTATNTEIKDNKNSTKGTTLDEALTKFFPKAYQNASDEEKEKLIGKYFKWLKENKKDQINELEQLRLYRNRCSEDDKGQYKRISGVIDKLEAKYQLKAAKMVITEGSENQKQIGQTTVASDIQNYDKSVQVGATNLIIESKNNEAIKIGASHASELDVDNQKAVVNSYMKTDIKDVQLELSNQVGAFGIYKDGTINKDVALDCFKQISSSKYQEVIENTALNIHTMKGSLQTDATQIIVNTGNDGAIRAAASQFEKYDKESQGNIANLINSSNSDNAKSALTSTQQKQTETTTNNTSSNNSTISENKVNEIKTILDSNVVQNKVAKISEAVKNASESEKLTLLDNYSTNLDVIKAILNSNPSLKVLSKIIELLNDDKFNNKNKDELINTIADSGAFKGENSKRIGMLSPALQALLVQNLEQSDLKNVKVNYLSQTAKNIFEKKLNNEESTSTVNQKFGLFGIKRTA